MPLINKQSNAILKFCFNDIYSWWAVSDLATQNLTSYVLNACVLTFHHSAVPFFSYAANYSWSLSFVAKWYCKAAVLLLGQLLKIFSRQYENGYFLALELLWSGMFELSRELTNPVFNNIAFGASHTYSHWHRSSTQYPQYKKGAGSRGPHLRTSCFRVKTFYFDMTFLEISLKIYKLTITVFHG